MPSRNKVWVDSLPKGLNTGVALVDNCHFNSDGSAERRRPNEDAHFNCVFNSTSLLMVLDGHDGDRAQEYAMSVMPEKVLHMMENSITDAEIKKGLEMIFEATDKGFFKSIDDILTRRVILKMELDECPNSTVAMQRFPENVNKVQDLDEQIKGGTTVAIAVIKHNVLYTANVGDTRVLLCLLNPVDNVLLVDQLTLDHNTQCEAELHRLQNLGLDPAMLRRTGRLGVQQNTRCIGDFNIKNGYTDTDTLRNALMEPGIASPHVTGPVAINQTRGFVIVMSDGLYRAWTSFNKDPYCKENLEIARMVASQMTNGRSMEFVAQCVVEHVVTSVKTTYIQSQGRNKDCQRVDDITIMIHNLGYNVQEYPIRNVMSHSFSTHPLPTRGPIKSTVSQQPLEHATTQHPPLYNVHSYPYRHQPPPPQDFQRSAVPYPQQPANNTMVHSVHQERRNPNNVADAHRQSPYPDTQQQYRPPQPTANKMDPASNPFEFPVPPLKTPRQQPLPQTPPLYDNLPRATAGYHAATPSDQSAVLDRSVSQISNASSDFSSSYGLSNLNLSGSGASSQGSGYGVPSSSPNPGGWTNVRTDPQPVDRWSPKFVPEQVDVPYMTTPLQSTPPSYDSQPSTLVGSGGKDITAAPDLPTTTEPLYPAPSAITDPKAPPIPQRNAKRHSTSGSSVSSNATDYVQSPIALAPPPNQQPITTSGDDVGTGERAMPAPQLSSTPVKEESRLKRSPMGDVSAIPDEELYPDEDEVMTGGSELPREDTLEAAPDVKEEILLSTAPSADILFPEEEEEAVKSKEVVSSVHLDQYLFNSDDEVESQMDGDEDASDSEDIEEDSNEGTINPDNVSVLQNDEEPGEKKVISYIRFENTFPDVEYNDL